MMSPTDSHRYRGLHPGLVHKPPHLLGRPMQAGAGRRARVRDGKRGGTAEVSAFALRGRRPFSLLRRSMQLWKARKGLFNT